MAKVEYRTVSLRTLAGWDAAERLLSQGWSYSSIGIFTIQFYRKGGSNMEVHLQTILSRRQRQVKALFELAKYQFDHHHDPANRGDDGSSGSTFRASTQHAYTNLAGKPFYAVGVHGEAFDSDLQLADLVEFWTIYGLEDNGEFARVAVGTWYDPEADKTYIDLVTLIDKSQPDYPGAVLERTLALGRAYGQQTICDLETLEIIKC